MTDGEEKAIRELKTRWQDLLGERMLKLVLFGSRARGDYSPESDIDIAVVVRELTRDMKEKMLDVVAEIELKHLTSQEAGAENCSGY